MPDCFLTFAERSDSQRRATLATQTELFSEGESSFPSAAWERTCAAIDENFVFLRGFFREELCLHVRRSLGAAGGVRRRSPSP